MSSIHDHSRSFAWLIICGQQTLKARKADREDLGVQLYGVQQELARNQMAVETVHDEYAEKKQER